jgi:hypothetical protein
LSPSVSFASADASVGIDRRLSATSNRAVAYGVATVIRKDLRAVAPAFAVVMAASGTDLAATH